VLTVPSPRTEGPGIARALDLDVNLLYFLARRPPVELEMNNISEEQGVAAYCTFRRELTKKREKAMVSR
jgi:hypothetical protein